MRKRSLRLVFLVLLAAGALVAAASPAWANGFQKDEYQVNEYAGYVNVTVQVKFVPMGQGQIDYHTSDLTAIAGHDYQQTSGTVTFVSGTYGVQDIRIPINQDELIEVEEQFEVKLTNFRGSFVDRGYETALVRIFDDDQKPAPSGSSSPGTSTQKLSASKAGSTAGSASASSAIPGTTGSTSADTEFGAVMPNEASFENGVGRTDESEPTAAKSLDDNWSSDLHLLALKASLLAAVIIGAGFILEKRLRRRAP
jgi:hypothetical protein